MTTVELDRLSSALARMRALATEFAKVEGDLRSALPALEANGGDTGRRWADVLSRFKYAADELLRATTTGEEEFSRLILGDSSSTMNREMLRFLLQRSRQAVESIEATWGEIDTMLLDWLVRGELDKPQVGEDHLFSQWGDDSHFARAALNQVLAQTRGRQPKDEWMLRLKYERGYTQQQIADLLYLAQSTVATRLARIEEQITQDVAIRKVCDLLQRLEGLHVIQVPGATGFDLIVDGGDDARVAVEVKAAEHDDTRPKANAGREELYQLRRLVRLTSPTGPTGNIAIVVVAVYFRTDGAVGFYAAEDLLEYAETIPDFAISALSKERGGFHDSLSELLRTRKGGGSRG